MVRPIALTAAIVASLLAVAGAVGTNVQTPKRGGTVVIPAPGVEPPCINLWLADCHPRNEPVGGLMDQTLQLAVEPGPHGWRNVLVSSMTLTKKPFTVTYHIRPEARWSDGVPVTASDFLFSYQASLKYGDLDPGDPVRSAVRRVSVVDKKTFRVEYRKPFKSWRLFPQRPLPSHVLAGVDFATVWKDGIDDPRTGEPIGNGPFLIQRWDKGQQLVLVRNPHYWGPHTAYLDRLVFRFVVPSDDLVAALQSREIDLVWGQGAFELAREPPSGFSVLSVPGNTWEHLEIRVARGGNRALRKTLVRRALAYGIDRDAIVRKLFANFAPTVSRLDNTMYFPGEPGYQPNWSRYVYRPALARRLLQKAGCHRGADGIYACAGVKLSLYFTTYTDDPTGTRIFRLVQHQLRRAGVEVLPTYVPFFAFDSILTKGDFDVALFPSVFDPGDVGSPYVCGQPGFSGYCSRVVTADEYKLDDAADPEREAVLANAIDRILARDVPTIPLFQNPYFIVFRDTIHGVVPSAFNDPTWNAVDWWVER